MVKYVKITGDNSRSLRNAIAFDYPLFKIKKVKVIEKSTPSFTGLYRVSLVKRKRVLPGYNQVYGKRSD